MPPDPSPTPALPTGFLVIHGNRLEDLRDLVIEYVRERPLGPLVPELFLVQSNGMKQWLQQALARDDAGLGICAATRVELPATFLWQAYRAVLGRDAVPAHLLFDKDALTWRLLRLLPACAAADPVRYAPLKRYLEEDPAGRRGWQLAQQVADVLDGYQQYRADWLAAWERGEEHEVPEAQRWQPALWRALREDVGAQQANTSRAAVHNAFVQAMAARPDDAARPMQIPPRIFVFGISALPMQSVQALAELGRISQVIMVVQNPCEHEWSDVTESRGDARPAPHALLASWGKQGRDYLHLLNEFDQSQSRPHQLGRTDVFRDPCADAAADGPSRLQRLQRSFLALEPAPAEPLVVPEDASLRFVTAHSALREVEILQDQLLAWLDADATLKPQDIMVMVPDMSGFAAQIQAVFGRYERGHPRHLPYSLADTATRQLPLVQALERLLGLPQSRITLADWIALFEVRAVRQRFGLAESDVAELREWLERAGVRWGLSGAHRETQGLPPGLADAEQNSWASGLRRLLLGYAQPRDAPWQGVLPVPGISGLAAQRVGALADWLAAMQTTLEELSAPRTAQDWVQRLLALVTRFFDPVDEEEERLLHRLRQTLLDWQQLCELAQFTGAVPLVVVREHWLSELEGPGLGQRFFGGGVQFATLLPMRAIPFRVVCLMGMNDSDYPRRAEPRDFDLMPRVWRAGDRSRREDDRYLFLEAVLSARERLYVSWVGRRATDNTAQVPSVVVGQLRDELKRRYAPLSDPLQYPLQPFSRRYFQAGTPFVTYDADWQPQEPAALAQRVRGEGSAAVAMPAVLGIADLRRLLRQPVEVFWRSRLGITLEAPDTAIDEDEPFELDPLQEYQLVQQLLRHFEEGGSARARELLQLEGCLPFGAPGQRLAREYLATAQRIHERTVALREAYSLRPTPLVLTLEVEGQRIEDQVAGLYERGGDLLQLVLVSGATLHKVDHKTVPRHAALVRHWVVHVVVAAAGYRITTVIGGADGEVHLPPLEQELARDTLRDWLTVLHAAWLEPLPVACQSACAFLLSADHAAAQQQFEGQVRREGEYQRSAYLRRSFRSYEDLRGPMPRWAPLLYGRLLQQLQPGMP